MLLKLFALWALLQSVAEFILELRSLQLLLSSLERRGNLVILEDITIDEVLLVGTLGQTLFQSLDSLQVD